MQLKRNINILSFFGITALFCNLSLGFLMYLYGLYQNFTIYMFAMTVITFISMFVISLMSAKFCGGLKVCVKKYTRKLGFFDNALLVVSGFCGCIAINLTVSIIVSLFPFMGGGNSDISDRTDMFGIMLMTLAVAVSPALFEETAFRGFAMGSLSDFGQGFAVFLSSLFFGMMHGNLSSVIFAFATGLLLGCIRKTSGSLVPCMMVHFLNNAFSIWTNALSKIMPMEIYTEMFLGFCMTAILLLIVSGVVIGKRKIGLFEFSDNDCLLSKSEKVKITLTRPIFWIFMAFAVSICFI